MISIMGSMRYLPVWRNGRRARLKIVRETVGVQVPSPAPLNKSKIMEVLKYGKMRNLQQSNYFRYPSFTLSQKIKQSLEAQYSESKSYGKRFTQKNKCLLEMLKIGKSYQSRIRMRVQKSLSFG